MPASIDDESDHGKRLCEVSIRLTSGQVMLALNEPTLLVSAPLLMYSSAMSCQPVNATQDTHANEKNAGQARAPLKQATCSGVWPALFVAFRLAFAAMNAEGILAGGYLR